MNLRKLLLIRALLFLSVSAVVVVILFFRPPAQSRPAIESTPGSEPSGPIQPGPIQHVVVIMQENRSFDHLFHGFPGADTAETGLYQGNPIRSEERRVGKEW